MPHKKFFRWLTRLLRLKQNLRVGIYGPPNSGKTSLANKIMADCIGGAGWTVSTLPHETTHVYGMEEIVLKSGRHKLTIDLFDMPGISIFSGRSLPPPPLFFSSRKPYCKRE